MNTSIIEDSLAIDDLTLALTMVFCTGGIATVLLSWRSRAVEEAGEGEYFALLLTSILGMVVLVAAQNLVVLFLGFELLSIPLYVLCATHMRREQSLESGLKYLIIGSVGSATLLYGLAFIYGATGATDYVAIAEAATDDVLLFTGIALVVAGLAFKASVAPFHQWTPDVYEGAPTAVTGFMAVATKAAAFGVLLRLFDVALIDFATTWGPALSVLAIVTIVVGNVGAIGQSSLKRLLAYSSVAQAGYMLAGVMVSTRLGVAGDRLLPRRLHDHEPRRVRGDRGARAGDRAGRRHLVAVRARRRPAAARVADDDRDAGPGGHAGHGRVLRQAVPDPGRGRQRLRLDRRGDRDRVGDLARLLPARDRGGVDALAVGGGRPAAGDGARRAAADRRRLAGGRCGDRREVAAPRPRRQPEVLFVAVVCAVATIALGVFPEPLFDVARDAGDALRSLV